MFVTSINFAICYSATCLLCYPLIIYMQVAFLRSALGNNAVACPSLSLSPATFGVAAKAAVSAAGRTGCSLFHCQQSLNSLSIAFCRAHTCFGHFTHSLQSLHSRTSFLVGSVHFRGWQSIMHNSCSFCVSLVPERLCLSVQDVGVTAYNGAVSVILICLLNPQISETFSLRC